MQIIDLCTHCHHWTITVIEHDSKEATFTCSHCQNTFKMPWDTDTRFLIRSIRHSLKKRTKQYPELKTLKAPGDHILLEERAAPEPSLFKGKY
ncbi:MAG: hypothetical protein KUG64_00785 [Cycloclasticus sp.]|nr:hypothetical protein [Cycloclasticus sp.]